MEDAQRNKRSRLGNDIWQKASVMLPLFGVKWWVVMELKRITDEATS